MRRLWHRFLCKLGFHYWTVPSAKGKVTWSGHACWRCGSSRFEQDGEWYIIDNS